MEFDMEEGRRWGLFYFFGFIYMFIGGGIYYSIGGYPSQAGIFMMLIVAGVLDYITVELVCGRHKSDGTTSYSAPNNPENYEPTPHHLYTKQSSTLSSLPEENTQNLEPDFQKWIQGINPDSQSFQQCPNCQGWVFLMVSDEQDNITFVCPNCQTAYEMQK